MTVARIGKKYTQCVKHADLGIYTQCVYTDVMRQLKRRHQTKKNHLDNHPTLNYEG